MADDVIPINNEEEEQPTIEEEFRALLEAAHDMTERVKAYGKKLQSNAKEPVTKGDLAAIYMTISEDVLSFVTDLVSSTGEAFTDVGSLVEDDGEGDEEEEDDVSAEEAEDAFKVFVTLKQNISVFESMQRAPGVTEEGKQGLQHQIDLNKEAVSVITNQFDDFEQQWQDLQKQTQAAMEANDKPPETIQTEATTPG